MQKSWLLMLLQLMASATYFAFNLSLSLSSRDSYVRGWKSSISWFLKRKRWQLGRFLCY